MSKIVSIAKHKASQRTGRLASFRPDYREKLIGRAIINLIDMRNSGEDESFPVETIAPAVWR